MIQLLNISIFSINIKYILLFYKIIIYIKLKNIYNIHMPYTQSSVGIVCNRIYMNIYIIKILIKE